MASGKFLQFGPYTVDPVSERIWRSDGEPLHLTPKSLAVLLYLIRERPRIVTKDHLQTRAVIDRRDGRWSLTCTLEDITGVVPESLRQVIDVTVDRLSEGEQRVLEAASVCGSDFAAAAVAAALDGDRLAARLVQSLDVDSPLARVLANANHVEFAAAVP